MRQLRRTQSLTYPSLSAMFVMIPDQLYSEGVEETQRCHEALDFEGALECHLHKLLLQPMRIGHSNDVVQLKLKNHPCEIVENYLEGNLLSELTWQQFTFEEN